MQLFSLHSEMCFVATLVPNSYLASIAVLRALMPSVTSNRARYLACECQCVISVFRIKAFVIRTTVL